MTQSARLCLLFVGLLLSSAAAHAKAPEPVESKIARLVQEAGLGEQIGIEVVRLHDGAVLYQNQADRPLNPASNLKLLTAAAALWNLGPSFRASTRVEGRLEAGRVERLILRAAGDPSLDYRRLFSMAQALKLRGVDRVERVVIDEGYFDAEVIPPAFEQQPDETAAFRAPVAAFSVDRNSYTVNVGPGPGPGAPGRVRVLAEGYIALDNQLVTKAKGPPKVWIDEDQTEEGLFAVRVRGEVPMSTRTIYYRRRMPDPRSHAASLWVRALKQAGIEGPLRVAHEPGASPEPLLADMPSDELSALLYSVGKWSDNFTAEMVLKIMGAEAAKPGSSARGVQTVIEELVSRGVNLDGLAMVNGSGLFDGNLVAPHHLTQTLVAAYRDPAIRPEYVAQLAVGGVDGTLQSRLRNLPRPRMVRAKTGTLRDSIALSGYVLGDPERSVAFSFLANGIAGKQGRARALADAIVSLLADYAVAQEPAAE